MEKCNWMDVLKEFPVPPEDPGSEGAIEGEISAVKVVLFDVYGTLVKPLIGDLDAQLRNKMTVESFEDALKWYGMEPAMGKELYKRFYEKISYIHENLKKVGIKQPEVLIEHVWLELLAEKEVHINVDDARRLAIYREMKANPVAPFRGATACIKALNRKGILTGIVSNSQFYTMPILGKALKIDPMQFFEGKYMFLSYLLGFAKPDPHFFLLASRRLAVEGINSDEVVVIGNDWENDVLSAKKFGFQAIFFRGEGKVQEYDPEVIGKGTAIAYNFEQVRRLLNIGG